MMTACGTSQAGQLQPPALQLQGMSSLQSLSVLHGLTGENIPPSKENRQSDSAGHEVAEALSSILPSVAMGVAQDL